MTDPASPGRFRIPRPDETDEFTVTDEADLAERAGGDSPDDVFETFLRRGVPIAPRTVPGAGDDESGDGRRRGRGALAAFGVRVGWLIVALLIGLGSAGIVAATTHSPASGSRPELTWSADQSFGATLADATDAVRAIGAQVDALAALARSARSSLTQQNRVALEAAVGDGNKLVASILGASDALNAQLACAQGSERFVTRNSAALVDRFARICLALRSTATLREDWIALADGAETAIEVADQIGVHEQLAGEAVLLGSKAQYAKAIAKLGEATDALANVRRLHDVLAAIADVSTLGDWVFRTQTMDDALGAFWSAMIESKGKVTPKVTLALQAVNRARDQLPGDARYMAVVLSEMAQGGVDQAAISIGLAKGRLSAAVEELDQTDLPSP